MEIICRYLRKDGLEDTTNHLVSFEIHVLLGVSGDMFRIIRVVESTEFNAICEFGDSGGDMVIDAEGHCSVGYCLVPKN